MELALAIIAVIGILIFVFSYLRFIIAGFRHHVVTGIIAIFPVANLLVIPSLWYRTGRLLLAGILGLVFTAGAWFAGAEKGLSKYMNLLNGKQNSEMVSTSQAINHESLPIVGNSADTSTGLVTYTNDVVAENAITTTSSFTATNSNEADAPVAIISDETSFEKLPGKALYKMSFEEVAVSKAPYLVGRIVQITDKTHALFEGRISKTSPSSVFLQQTGKDSGNREIPLTNILKLKLMVKKP